MRYLQQYVHMVPGPIEIEIDVRDIALHRVRLVYQFKVAVGLTSSNISAPKKPTIFWQWNWGIYKHNGNTMCCTNFTVLFVRMRYTYTVPEHFPCQSASLAFNVSRSFITCSESPTVGNSARRLLFVDVPPDCNWSTTWKIAPERHCDMRGDILLPPFRIIWRFWL